MEMTKARTLVLEGDWWQDPTNPQVYLFGTRGDEPIAGMTIQKPLVDGDTVELPSPLIVTIE